jgi:hypothetical protein
LGSEGYDYAIEVIDTALSLLRGGDGAIRLGAARAEEAGDYVALIRAAIIEGNFDL